MQASGEGHTFLPEEELTKRAGELLGVAEEAIEKQYIDLSIERKIIMKQENDQVQIYGAPLYYTEVNTAMMLKNLDIAYDVSDADYEERMEFLNEVLDLPDFFDRPVRTLSLGQRMRADLGAALIHNPKVLYLDEPTIGLDLVVKDKIREAIRVINEKYHTTVILTTHDIGDIEELCSRIIVIDEGHKIYDGSLAELKDTYGTKRSVIMEVRSVQQAKNLDWVQILGADQSVFSVEGDEENNQLMISFDKNDLQVSDVISAAMSATEVKDIKIQETELSEIVKEIYRHQLNV